MASPKLPVTKARSENVALSVVIPMYNEAENIAELVRQLEETFGEMKLAGAYEVVLVNDGSRDGTLAEAKKEIQGKAGFRLLDLSRNFGHEVAMTAGLQACRGELVVMMDADLQDPPALIPHLLKELRAKDVDVVYARRTSRAGETWLKRLTSTLFYRLAKKLTRLEIPEDAGDFRIMTRAVVEALNRCHEHDRNLKMLYAYVGFKKSSVPFDRPARHAGRSHYNWLKLIGAALDSIISFSTLPLRLVSLLGATVSAGLFLMSMWVVVRKVLGTYAVEGWTSMMVVQTLLFSVLFLFLAVLSEYVGRLLTETKGRPLYYIRETIDGDA